MSTDSPRVGGGIVPREYTAHDILVDAEAEDVRELLGDAHTAEVRIALFHSNNGRDELRGGFLRPGFTQTSR